MTTEKEAEKVQQQLVKELLQDFNNTARPPVNAIGIGMDGDGYHVMVGLSRAPTREEDAKIPTERDGVRIKRRVIGEIKPL